MLCLRWCQLAPTLPDAKIPKKSFRQIYGLDYTFSTHSTAHWLHLSLVLGYSDTTFHSTCFSHSPPLPLIVRTIRVSVFSFHCRFFLHHLKVSSLSILLYTPHAIRCMLVCVCVCCYFSLFRWPQIVCAANAYQTLWWFMNVDRFASGKKAKHSARTIECPFIFSQISLQCM